MGLLLSGAAFSGPRERKGSERVLSSEMTDSLFCPPDVTCPTLPTDERREAEKGTDSRTHFAGADWGRFRDLYLTQICKYLSKRPAVTCDFSTLGGFPFSPSFARFQFRVSGRGDATISHRRVEELFSCTMARGGGMY